MYPNYTLPDLGFLRDERLDLDQVFLTPWRFSPGWTPLASPTQAPVTADQPLGKRTRPHSCADINHLRKKGKRCISFFLCSIGFYDLIVKKLKVKFYILRIPKCFFFCCIFGFYYNILIYKVKFLAEAWGLLR